MRVMPPKKVITKITLPNKTAFHRCAAYARVIFNCRVVNSTNSWRLQLSNDGVRHCGTNLIGNPASWTARVNAKSSETVPRQCSFTLHFSKVDRLIAVDPPQQKFFFPSAPRAEAIAAFQTERKFDANPPRAGTNQR